MKKLFAVILLLITAGGVYFYLTYKPPADNNENSGNQVTTSPMKLEENNEIIIFHNGTGPMCIEALNFFKEKQLDYTEYLNTEADFQDKLIIYMGNFDGKSEGVSDSFSYYPIIFVGGRAFSGFDDEVGQEILTSLAQ